MCQAHGDNAPQVRRAAERQQAEAYAKKMLQRLGQPDPLGHPVEELLAIGAEARSWLGVLREQVSELDSLESTDVDRVERAHAVVELYERAMDRTERVLVNLLKLDLDAKRLALAKRQAEALDRVLGAVYEVVPPDVRDRAERAATRELRSVLGPGPEPVAGTSRPAGA